MINVKELNSPYAYQSDGYVFIDAVDDSVFSIGGIKHPTLNCGEYYRLDASRKELYSSANRGLAYNTSGAQVRVLTDAERVYVKIFLHGNGNGMHHFADRGVYGVDFYQGLGTDRRYVGAHMVTFADSITFNDGVLQLGAGEKEFYINLPLYEGVKKVEIGFPEDSSVGKPHSRAYAPVCFYGSSITQGGCVSRPGSMYPHILCRQIDADCMNMGFSGAARGEIAVAKYIASREMSAFVMDYDYNASSAGELKHTHNAFYRTIRDAHPDMPVIFVTHPYYAEETEYDRMRKDVIRETYQKAVDAGENVYFVDSESFFPTEMRDLFAVDNLHPNDLGNYYMAKTLLPVLKQALGISR